MQSEFFSRMPCFFFVFFYLFANPPVNGLKTANLKHCRNKTAGKRDNELKKKQAIENGETRRFFFPRRARVLNFKRVDGHEAQAVKL